MHELSVQTRTIRAHVHTRQYIDCKHTGAAIVARLRAEHSAVAARVSCWWHGVCIRYNVTVLKITF